MVISGKKKIIISAAVVAVLGAGSSYALIKQKPTQKTPVVNQVESVKIQPTTDPEEKQEQPLKTEVVQQEPTTPTQTPSTQTPVQSEPTPTTTPSVRSYSQLIEDYDYTEYKSYLDKLKAKYPERFSESMIEDTFAYIKRVYASPMAAMYNIEKFGWDIAR
jgi:hypothetical protein